jgi:energy-converting hydrogenase Eha subunit H
MLFAFILTFIDIGLVVGFVPDEIIVPLPFWYHLILLVQIEHLFAQAGEVFGIAGILRVCLSEPLKDCERLLVVC